MRGSDFLLQAGGQGPYEPSRMADMGVTHTSRYIRSTHPRMASISASDGSGNSNFQTAPEKRKSGNVLVSCYGLV